MKIFLKLIAKLRSKKSGLIWRHGAKAQGLDLSKLRGIMMGRGFGHGPGGPGMHREICSSLIIKYRSLHSCWPQKPAVYLF